MYANYTKDGTGYPACTPDSNLERQQLVVNFRESLAPTELTTHGDNKRQFPSASFSIKLSDMQTLYSLAFHFAKLPRKLLEAWQFWLLVFCNRVQVYE